MPFAPVEIMGRRFTRADLEDLPDDGRRYELIDGVLIVSAAPGRLHQRAVFSLAVLLRTACPPEFEVLIAPFAVGLAEDGEFRQVADVTGHEVFEPAVPFPVRVVPADLVRWPPVT